MGRRPHEGQKEERNDRKHVASPSYQDLLMDAAGTRRHVTGSVCRNFRRRFPSFLSATYGMVFLFVARVNVQARRRGTSPPAPLDAATAAHPNHKGVARRTAGAGEQVAR